MSAWLHMPHAVWAHRGSGRIAHPSIADGAGRGIGIHNRRRRAARGFQAIVQQAQHIGRMGLRLAFEKPDGRKYLLDGAHNIAGAKVLREAIEKRFGVAEKTLILGIFEDKDWRHICEILAPAAKKIFTVAISSERTADQKQLAEVCRGINAKAEIFICNSLEEALQKTPASPKDLIIITGSLYLVGEALELLGLSSCTKSERELNEWTAIASSMDHKNLAVAREKQA